MRWPWSKKPVAPSATLNITIADFVTEGYASAPIPWHVLRCRVCGHHWKKLAPEAALYGVSCPKCQERGDWTAMLADWRARIAKEAR